MKTMLVKLYYKYKTIKSTSSSFNHPTLLEKQKQNDIDLTITHILHRCWFDMYPRFMKTIWRASWSNR